MIYNMAAEYTTQQPMNMYYFIANHIATVLKLKV